MASEPRTLQQAIIYFSNPDNCLTFLQKRRWPKGVVTCPRCGSKNVGFIKSRRLWQCKDRSHPKAQFSIKVGTIFEDSPIGLDKWLTAMWMVANCKNGVSSWEIHRSLGITQKSAWFMLHRIRLALQDDFSGGMLSGEVEVDESFIGGKARNMHRSRLRKLALRPGRGNTATTAVMGMLERGGQVRTKVIPDAKKRTLQPHIRKNVEKGATVYTDDHSGYFGVDKDFMHKVVNHTETYVDGQVHTQGIENFWSCLKRGLNGTYVSVEPFHLFRYLDEQVFRYNHRRNMKDHDRFNVAVRRIVGKRLTYKQVTGKEGETTCR